MVKALKRIILVGGGLVLGFVIAWMASGQRESLDDWVRGLLSDQFGKGEVAAPEVDAPSGTGAAAPSEAETPAPLTQPELAVADPGGEETATTEETPPDTTERTGAATSEQASVDTKEEDGTESAVGTTGENVAPVFDVVRVSPDGEAVIAGRTSANIMVEVLLDGTVVASAESDASGSFVIIASLGASSEARSLQLRVKGGDASETQLLAASEAGTTGAETTVDASSAGTGTVAQDVLETVEADGTPTESEGATDETSVAVIVEEIESAAAETLAQGAGTPKSKPSTATTSSPEASIEAETPEAVGETADPSAEVAVQQPATEPVDQPADYALSTPVVILPTAEPEEAPILVAPQSDGIARLAAPTQDGELDRIRLDRISYEPGGDVAIYGAARRGTTVRVYANAEFISDATSRPDGGWSVIVPPSRAETVKLFRFDEVSRAGEVLSRIEAPFAYRRDAPDQEVRQREITVQRGDNLWTFAEQYYGQGIRYSLIYGANSQLIRDPDLIYPGQIFTIPELVDSE